MLKGNRKGGSNYVHMEVIKLWRESWLIEKTKPRGLTFYFSEANPCMHVYFMFVSFLMISEVRQCLTQILIGQHIKLIKYSVDHLMTITFHESEQLKAFRHSSLSYDYSIS